MSDNVAGTGLSADQLRGLGLGALVPETGPVPALAELDTSRAEERRQRGAPHGLSADEVETADANGMTLERYAELKRGTN
jgi:hypothetical protein